jgi:hypothetical protein
VLHAPPISFSILSPEQYFNTWLSSDEILCNYWSLEAALLC